ncbi:hypothetical protein SPF06_02500 [Sinomonas sp. JGH33]|uniref:Uncharacterized protein n=1 Tax=Sinomonas terricola TaxID=3110330 RepID=A0ABU5T1N7_9MICC|nr:hypothetical protein [Sinomonas sp. JGH33]MEA5453583.1 hypothetical protein [Sinomonas sp. JGH33]
MSPTKRNTPLDPAPDTPDAILAAADAEISAAQDAVTALTAAVKAGDETITQDSLIEAEKRVSWAKLRRAAADVKARQLADQQAKEAAAKAVETFYTTATADIEAQVRQLLDQARGPIAEALEAIATKNAAVHGLATALASNPQPENPVTFAGMHPETSWVDGPDGRRHIYTPGRSLVLEMLDEVVHGL